MHAVEHGGHGASARHLVYMLESTRPPSQADCLSPAHPAAPPRPAAVLTYFEDNRVAEWLVFSDVWNAVR